MNTILVAYQTHSGTTREVAEAVAEEMTKKGFTVDVSSLNEIHTISNYDAVVLGAPMIMGWHRSAQKFLTRHKSELAQKPLAVFVTAMSLTHAGMLDQDKIHIHVDEQLAAAPVNPGRLNLKEHFTSIKQYTRPIISKAPSSLKSIALFGGRLDFYRLKWWEALFVMILIGAQPGEKRNWPDIRSWAAGLPDLLQN